MKCPNCNVDLVMTDRNGIEIDYCPQCRGIWLDRGELDKLIERSTQFIPNQRSEGYSKSDEYRKKDYDESREYNYKYGKRKKESFLGDLFDF